MERRGHPSLIMESFEKLRDIYLTMERPWKKYLRQWVILPTLLATLLVIFLVLGLPDIFSNLYLRVLLCLLPVYLLIVMLMKPAVDHDRRKHKIDQEIHLFITRIGVLSISNISQKGMFNILSGMKEYGELAKEITKVFNLVDNWGISLGEACRIVAKSTPSRIFSDFLYRLAHAIDSGESIGTFFKNEQKVIMDEYEINYEKSLYSIEVIKEMFVAMVTSAAFIFVIVTLYPMLTGGDATSLLVLSIFVFAFVEFLFLFILASVIPEEYIWQSSDIKTEVNKKINRYLMGGGAVSLFIGLIFLVWRPEISIILMLSLAFTPLTIPALYVHREERVIKRREENFSAFIRSLGSTTESRAISMTTALKRLKEHDFGPLTGNIKDLNKRLSLHIDSRKAWKYFGAETGSDLALKFSEMFLEGTLAGGRTKDMSQIISDNFNRILGLRMRRYASASTMIGLLYGIAIFVALVLFLSVGIVNEMADIYSTIDIPAGYEDIEVLHPLTFEGWLLTFSIAILIFIHAVISSMMSRVAGGGHKAGALFHISALLWIGFIMEIVANWMLDLLMV